MASKRFPILTRTLQGIIDFCEEVTRTRDEDITEFDNLQNIFIKGRKVGKIPVNSTTSVGDRVGDFNFDASYIYICVDNAGTAEWRRVAIGSFLAMGFFSDVSSFVNGGSKSSSNSQSGFSLLPAELQAAFKDYAPLISQYTNPNDPANVERFTPMAQTAGETSALARMGAGFTPDQATLDSDIAMQMNPFDDSVISEINRQSQGDNSVLQQSLDESGQFGSNRGILGANDIDLSRMNLIGKFKQDQYNTALNNSLTTLTDSRRTDATGALTGGTYARNLDTATKQAPIQALTTFGQLLGAIPQSGGSNSTSQSSSQNGFGDTLAAGALAFSDKRLKKDIKKIGEKNGFNLYSFRYLWSPVKYIGVMAQEVKKLKPEAVKDRNGFLMVDYAKLGLKMVRA